MSHSVLQAIAVLHSCLRKGQTKREQMRMQLALDPIWKAYEACSPGADTQGILGKIVKALQLNQVCLACAM